MFKTILYTACLSLVFLGCGTENPFDRGPDYDDGSLIAPGLVEDMSFSANVMPVLSKCTGCHAGGTGGWTYDGGTEAYTQAFSVVDTAAPENSLLLIKGSGGDGHGGGSLFSSASDDYQKILAWISDGAPDN